MSKKNLDVLSVVATETTKSVSGKVSANVDLVENSAFELDAEESDNPKKDEVFGAVKELFGFSRFDRETAALSLQSDWTSGKITFKEFSARLAKLAKENNKANEKLENKTFETVCETIQKSTLINDVAVFVGTSDLLSLKPLLVDAKNRVILYHGKQSEESEKFETVKVTKKGLHKPYSDVCYLSYLESTTSNIIRALRNYSYYIQSINRVNRQIRQETRNSENLANLTNVMHKDFGFMPNDFVSLAAKALNMKVSEFLAKVEK